MKTAVIIPCYKVKKYILHVIEGIGLEVDAIFVIDDACPEKTGDFVDQFCLDARVSVIRHADNQGVGGAMLTGYKAALDVDCDVLVKLDGDGQMDPSLIRKFVTPIARGEADYTKGNRFFDLETITSMPRGRLFGNAVLSFFTKFSSGYYDIFDPTNGYTAISSTAAKMLPFSKISHRYFFESDMLFRLNIIRAVVVDVPMTAVYGDEVSNLRIRHVLLPFLSGHFSNFLKRLFYGYFLRGFSVASLELILGLFFSIFGIGFGAYAWYTAAATGNFASSGAVMLSALPLILGVQLILAFINFDIQQVPTKSLTRLFKQELY